METKEFPGVALRDADIREKRVLTTLWYPNLKYAWDAGIAISRFLSELKQGRIIGTKCHQCRRTVVPPRIFCEWCFKPMEEWVYLQDSGKVNTYSISYIAWDASRVKEPTIPAVIEIDGASPGMGFLHFLSEIEPDPRKIRVGMRVKAVWKPPQEREGAITDIKYFKPIEEG
jgi:hypothetical protein